ncbi:hypothetical protein B0J15DRAFT_514964 [Fusarium solani]|uniref:Zn(2)-C6 fungal-type domain-containing protein n=1 Tax=Fusarium solani TaxID=169388 RepID=A0A9P9GYH1_FUSSL|nr:uncharacterized protein B0J15DRAFT_514964 [Fusarium solani]KAH7247058.1 hypothetical protein B0J15DRAFT_514964 [Fusarium solani]
MPQPVVKRACDACHRRKVRCNGANPCRNCSGSQLLCTYNAIPQKKGPKGSRAKVISELRETQRQTSLAAKVHQRLTGAPVTPQNYGPEPSTGLLSNEFMKDCLRYFFDNVYGQMPILDRRALEEHMTVMEQGRDVYCLLSALCAFVMLQPGTALPVNDSFNLELHPGANIAASQLLLDECIRVRKANDYQDSITHYVLVTNYLIFACHFALDNHDKAWFYLRETSTMMHMAGMHKEDFYSSLEREDATRRRHLYWLVLMTERSYAIQRNRPQTLQSSIRLPGVGDETGNPRMFDVNTFAIRAKLFQPFDNACLATWKKVQSQFSAAQITGLQKQLQEAAIAFSCQDTSLADMGTNQQWLQNLIWQLTPNNGPDGNEEYMAPSHMIESLLQACHLLNDVLYRQPHIRHPYSIGPHDHLQQLLQILGMLRHSHWHYLPLLLTKVIEVLPRLTNPILPNAPENCQMANIDIFDGFGNAGMAQPPMAMYQASMAIYQNQITTPDSLANSNGGNGTPPGSQQDNNMSSSFVTPPSVVSPGMEYPHNLTNFNVSDMVMSPMGDGTPPNSMNYLPNQQQQMSMQGDGMCQPQMDNMASRGMRNQSLNAQSMYDLQQTPETAGSYQMQSQAPMTGQSQASMNGQVIFSSSIT